MRSAILTILTIITSSLVLAGCTGHSTVCGEGQDPVIVTGLSGLLDGTPVVEIELVTPETCEVIDRTWMFWDESAQTATLGDAPSEGLINRGGITADDRTIVFGATGLAVELVYPDDMVASTLTLTWVASGVDLSSVDCDGTSGALACTVRAP